MTDYTFTPVGHIVSPYQQKFAIPRQPRLVPDAEAKLVFTGQFRDPDFIRGIEAFSHLWLLFIFHENADKGWSSLVRPPRLGGNEKRGVFATRATFRPNPIGMSAVELLGVGSYQGKPCLKLRGIDLLNGTPIVDIKPYLPYSDIIEQANGGFADSRPETEMSVTFTEQACQQIAALTQGEHPYGQLAAFISAVLKQDPRPAYKSQKSGEQSYGMTLYDLNIKWSVQGDANLVISVSKI